MDHSKRDLIYRWLRELDNDNPSYRSSLCVDSQFPTSLVVKSGDEPCEGDQCTNKSVAGHLRDGQTLIAISEAGSQVRSSAGGEVHNGTSVSE
jgi:hypothetical protein